VLDDVQYNGSTLQTAINTLATNSTYKINESDIYSQISARTLACEKLNYIEDENKNMITTDLPTTNSSINQTLWALSFNEANTLLQLHGTSSAITNNKTVDIVAGDSSTCSWWLRSPHAIYEYNDSAGARAVLAVGALALGDGKYVYGVRPAFKLVIA